MFTHTSASLGTLFKITLALGCRSRVILNSVPNDAEVWVNNQQSSYKTPALIEDINPGNLDIKLVHKGYLPWEQRILAKAGKSIALPTVILKPDKSLKQKSKSLRQRSPNQRNQRVSPSTELPTNTPLPKQTGTLRVNSRPWSQVRIDGRLIGSTPQLNISLDVGRHRVELYNPDFNVKKSFEVTIEAGKIQTQIVDLSPSAN